MAAMGQAASKSSLVPAPGAIARKLKRAMYGLGR
jgi:hypothetical protein